MADQPQAPTEEQLAQSKEAADAELAKWQGDFPEEQLEVPYKREEEKEEAKDEKKTEEDKSEKQEEEKKVEETEEDLPEPPEPEQIVTVEDPGEFKQADYSFEVTLADGKTYKIADLEQAEAIADDPDNFETPKQLLDFIRKANKMERNIERDREKWEAKKEKFDEQKETEAERNATIQNLANGINYLVAKGLLPEVEEKYANADWSNPEVAKQPGVREQVALLKYMDKENGERRKAGLPELASVLDAYNAMQADPAIKKVDEEKAKAEAEEKKAAQARKAAGARVAASSAPSQAPYVPKGIAVGNPNILKRGAAQWDD